MALFNLSPWRWTHWLMLLLGSVLVATYLGLLSWQPVIEAVERLQAGGPEQLLREINIIRAEGFVGLFTLLLLTPLVGVVGLFVLLLVWVGLAHVTGPMARSLRVPDWALILVIAAVLVGVVYAKSESWMPVAVAVVDRLEDAFLVSLL